MLGDEPIHCDECGSFFVIGVGVNDEGDPKYKCESCGTEWVETFDVD